jgi:hypothetical protein
MKNKLDKTSLVALVFILVVAISLPTVILVSYYFPDFASNNFINSEVIINDYLD